MAILHVKEIRKMKDEELDKKLLDLKKELMKARAKIAQGAAPDKPGRIKEIRKTIARILTIKRERGVSK
ncbi:MAG: 50S ribosomal protein L29 [Nanoarchaeota archaeon]|nr:50S ribosomal protein L29 [Nanoarchaeota archaeon]